jgi:hypothetical protein
VEKGNLRPFPTICTLEVRLVITLYYPIKACNSKYTDLLKAGSKSHSGNIAAGEVSLNCVHRKGY